MSGLLEVDCSGCGRRHVTNGEQARKLRVLRCECGQFVRLDRALAERRSEPTPPPVEVLRPNQELDEEDDATQMLDARAAVAALTGRGRSPQQHSFVDDERGSRPAHRPSTLRSLPPAAPRQASIAPTDKPLWYVDLGGTELVQMTIEQLILARRSGKLGEGALVWREGMPSWRPVGTLIPAASASSHPSPVSTVPSPLASPSPPASSGATLAPNRPPLATAIRTPLPSRPALPKRTPPPSSAPEDPTPQSLASYERPLATLEFALEKPHVAAIRSSLASIDSAALPGSRPKTPRPHGSQSRPFDAPFPRPAHLPRGTSLATSTPFPPPRRSPPPPAPLAAPTAVLAAPVARSSDRPSYHAQAVLQVGESLSERPRWLSACIALLVCVTASAAGASLVRNLKQQRKPQAPPTIAAPAPVINTAAESQPSELPRTASSAPVVDLESLSVEHKRTLPRAVRATPKPLPAEPSETSDQTAAPSEDSTAEASSPETATSSEVPAAARPNPYGSGSLIDQIKKATAEDEANQ
jgi:uncharacterized protein DUF4339